MSAAGKKKNKFKTVSLNEFLTDDKGAKPTVYMPASSSSWADEVDNDVGEEMDYGGPAKHQVNIAALPTAPRAARGSDVDMTRVPTNPPFTAFLGNIPFDVETETIEKFFHGFTILNIRLPEENGRMKGFGYVEFEDRQMLVDALNLNDAMLKNRKVRIDLAGQSQDGKDRGGHGGMGRDRDDGEDRTLGDWRKSDDRPSSSFEPRRSSDRFDDRGGSRYEDRGGGGFGGGRDGGGFGGGRDGGSRYDDRGGGGFGGGGSRDGGFAGRSDQGGSWGHDRGRNDDRSDDRRSFGSGFRDGGDRGGFRDRGDRGGGGGFRRDDRYGDRPPPRDNDRYAAPRDDYAPPRDRMPEDKDAAPRERPRLNLQPRSKPKEAESKSGESQASSIFGGAKPVNTAAREREIEERLYRQKDIDHDKERSRGPPERPRMRQDSAGSEEGRGPPRRERKLSSSSSGKGIRTVAPPPTTRVRSESSRSEEEVFEEKETKKEKTPEAKLVPAPPPKENVWAKRKPATQSGVPASPPSKENDSPPAKAAPSHQDEEKRQPMSDSNRCKGKFVAAESPRVNVWDKKKKDAPPKEKKEKALPQSIDEMPKYEEAQSKDFSDSNKFAGLMDDEDAE